MKENYLTGYLIDVTKETHGAISIERSLESYYKVLNCDLITITYRIIGGKEYCLICDDEGLLKNNAKVSAFSSSGHPQLVGNLLVVSADEGEDFNSISEDDIANISSQIFNISIGSGNSYPAVMVS